MAKLGTPENPEILEPNEAWRPVGPTSGRFRTVFRLTKSLALVLAPAVLLDWGVATLFLEGWNDQNPVSLVLSLLLLGPAAVCTLLAMLAGPLLFMSLVFALLGRTTAIRVGGFGRASARSV